MKLKVGAKILLGYAIVLVLLGIVAYLGYSGLNTVDGEYSDVVDKRIPVTVGILNIKALINEQTTNVRGFMLYRNQESLDNLSKLTEEIIKEQKSLEKALTTEQGRKLLARVEEANNKYDANADRIIQLYKAGKDGEAAQFIAEAGKAIKEFNAALDDLTSLNSELIKKNVSNAKDTAERQKSLTLITSFIAAILGIGIGIFFGRSISKPITALTAVANIVAQGDLTHEVPKIKTRDEVETLGQAFMTMVENLRNLIRNINDTSQHVAATSQQLSSNAEEATKATQQVSKAIDDVAKGTTEQTRNVNDTVRTVEQVAQAIDQIAAGAQEQNKNVLTTTELVEGMTGKIDLMAKGVEQIKEAAQQNGVIAKEGGKAVEKTVVGMERVKDAVFETANRIKELGEQSQKIGEIIQVIDDIAEQTNLLALNAAIEAARAGEHGKGFAVVADEVRKLAERSGKATKEIADLVTNIQKGTNVAVDSMEVGTKEVEAGVLVAQDAGKSLREIVEVVEQAGEGVQEIVKIIKEILESSGEVSKAINNVASVTEENTAATEEMSASAQQVNSSMQSLSAITEESAAAAEEVSASTEELTASTEEIAASADALARMAQQLQDLVNQFKI